MPGKGKKYYRIGEVSKLTGVEPHVLRYWEAEFRQIRTHRVAKQRLYRTEDVDLIKRIKNLLYNEGFTLAGAKRQLQEKPGTGNAGPESSHTRNSQNRGDELLVEIRKELIAIKGMLGHADDG